MQTKTGVLLILTIIIGVGAFLYPFFTITTPQASFGMAHSGDAPLILMVLLALCLGVVVAELETGQVNSKTIAILGILVAVNSVLRFIPGPAGFSAIFFLPILCGYVYGSVFGFLLGALSILVSALLGAGTGPWLPYQMFATGWMGMSASLLRFLKRYPRAEVPALAIWGFGWGFLFGAIMNLWFWPYLLAPGNMYWSPGAGFLEALTRYGIFYLATSVWWDAGRAVGNFILILALGRPVMTVLRRFQRRFQFVVL